MNLIKYYPLGTNDSHLGSLNSVNLFHRLNTEDLDEYCQEKTQGIFEDCQPFLNLGFGWEYNSEMAERFSAFFPSDKKSPAYIEAELTIDRCRRMNTKHSSDEIMLVLNGRFDMVVNLMQSIVVEATDTPPLYRKLMQYHKHNAVMLMVTGCFNLAEIELTRYNKNKQQLRLSLEYAEACNNNLSNK